MYKNGLGINNLQWLMCHKIKPNKNREAFCENQHQNSLVIARFARLPLQRDDGTNLKLLLDSG